MLFNYMIWLKCGNINVPQGPKTNTTVGGSRHRSQVLHNYRTLNGFISEAQDVRSAKNSPLLRERGNMVFDLRNSVSDSRGPQISRKPPSPIHERYFYFPFVRWINLKVSSEIEALTAGFNSAPLPVRFHFASSVWQLAGLRDTLVKWIFTQKGSFFRSLCLFLPFIFLPRLSPSATARLCHQDLRWAVGVYSKQPSALTIQLFIPLRRQKAVRCSPFEGVVGGLAGVVVGWLGGGLFITWVLCTGLWDDVLSVFDDCY